MAFRFGRSNWRDTDRLNLIEVCQKHQNWEQRLTAMREIYVGSGYPPTHFTENTCREELERILSSPAPNHPVKVDQHFSYSRKILMEKWADHLKSEIKKQEAIETEMALVKIRSNTAKIKEVLTPGVTEERIAELYAEAQRIAESRKNDPVYRRIVGTFGAAITERLKQCKGRIDLSGLDLPPTKPSTEETDPSTKGFLTPACTMNAPDVIFSPPRMLSLAEAVKEAVPVPEPSVLEIPEPQESFSVPSSTNIPEFEELPNEFMEPIASPAKGTSEKNKEKTGSPQKSPQKAQTPIASPIKPIVAPISPQKPIQKTPQKRKDQTPPEDVTMEETPVKEEETQDSFMPAPSNPPEFSIPGTPISSGPTPRGRGRPHKKTYFTKNIQEEVSDSGNMTTKKEKVENLASMSPSPETEIPVTKKRTNETSPQPTSSAKKSRNPPVVPPSSISTRRRREELEEEVKKEEPLQLPPPKPTVQPNGFDTIVLMRISSPSRFVPDPSKCCSGWCGTVLPPTQTTSEIQTDITIRQKIEDLPMGERRRSTVPVPSLRKGRKSQAPADSIGRSQSRNSSASTPGPRGSSATPARAQSTGPATYKNSFAQTNVRLDLEKEDVVVMRVAIGNVLIEKDTKQESTINEQTVKEIAAENAELGENAYDIGKRAAKVDGRREMTFIVESEECITQRLVEEKGYQVVSQSSDLPSAGPNDSPVKRPRRDEKAKEEVTQMRQQLHRMFRELYECEWSEAFKKPVPPGEVAYDQGVLQRIDLSMIKKEIENGTIASVPSFLLRCYRMLSNALMYNGYDHEVHIQAKNIFEQVMWNVDATEENTFDIQSSIYTTTNRRGREDHERPSSRTDSMEPEPFPPVGVVGTKRNVFRKNPNVDSPMTTEGNRRSKKSTK